ncbi:NTP transferase domain-containing protein [Aquabacter cavernae]|uniref:NTP transferase domain-containing protein n=1 Tax=Aquabacter cavernae TaxID=2496029 RepID=UPI000F8F52D4|nr:molybdopterin-binding/glycosyltransferase family 2 protein [Aquabacter cavernae]
MRFGSIPVEDAVGAIAAHAVKVDGLVLRKGSRITFADMDALKLAGVRDVVVARLDPGDLEEDAAARHVAEACAGEGVTAATAFTGRCNLYAAFGGVVDFDPALVDAFNLVDESLTLATLTPYCPVATGDLVGTVKVIPFAVPGALLETALGRARPVVRIAPFRRARVAVISTLLPGLQDKVIEKTLRVTADRLARFEARILEESRVPHEAEPLRAAIAGAAERGAQAIIVFGASAISDRSDVVPEALEAAGGRIERLGMPVDPGNLLMLGWLGDLPVIGAPGCARSPKENGFDHVLARLLADLPLGSADIARMGVGGLVAEIVTRPQPRETAPEAPQAPIAAVILAAGRGTRMGAANKLTEPVGGRAVVRCVAEAALAAGARPVLVVTGHEGMQVRRALNGLPVTFVDNPAYAEGLATSLGAGIRAVPPDCQGALVMLGDMPLVDAPLVKRLMAAFAPTEGRLVAVPVVEGRRGNPVLWSRRFFPALAALEGDMGARAVLAAHSEAVVEVEASGPGPTLDVDTPAALAEARAFLPVA